MNKDFCIFILTHGRPDKVITLNALKKSNYSGDFFLIVDNEDKTVDKYIENFGEDKVLLFDKLEISKTFDTFDNSDDRRAIVYARNVTFDFAKKLGYKYFMQLDDDYTDFRYKFNSKYEYGDKTNPPNLDKLLYYLLEFYKSISAKSIAIAQGGDFIGGKNGSFAKKITVKRKTMNTFICSVDRPFKFIGRINEDVNTYTTLQSRGNLFLTINQIGINQLMTQTNSGGMADMYLDSGTYIKSFFTVITAPNSCKIRLMGTVNKRLHHMIKWENAVPKIINEKHKK